MSTTTRKMLLGLALAAGVASWGPPLTRAEADGFVGFEAVPAQDLDSTRGGYQAGNDLLFSFGIEKAVYVNGVLEATSSMNLLQPAGGAGQLSQAPTFKLIQNGSGVPNIGKDVSAFSLPGQGFQGTIIQNSLDHQKIQTITKISVGVNAIGAFRENTLSGIVNRQLLQSLR